MRVFGRHQMGSANQDSEFQVRNLKSFHRGRPAICWLLPATSKSAAAESACRQYRAVRWLLLPEAGLRRRPLSPTTFVIVANQKCQLYHNCQKKKFPGNAVFPEMPCYQLFAIVTCPRVNVREATRGQAIHSGLQGHFCKNCCSRVFTPAICHPPSLAPAVLVIVASRKRQLCCRT